VYQKATLDNGLRLFTANMPHTRSVSICVFVGVGSRYETGEWAGVSHFIEHMCFKGTPKRPSPKEISVAIEGVGGLINAGTDKELTVYWAKVARPHFSLALDVLVDMLLNSSFDPDDIERERQVIIEEIHLSMDAPQHQVGMLIDELLWPGHPLGRDIAGSRESVSAISRDMLLEFLAGQYLPGDTVVAIVGDINHDEVVQMISESLGKWTDQRTRSGFLPYQEQPNPRLKIECRNTEQTHLCLALPGLPIMHPGRFTLDLLNTILGEGMSSRLFLEIRDRLGLAYAVHSYVEHFNDSGSIIIYAGVEHGNLSVTIEAILEQLALLKEPVSESEVTKAKELSKGRLLLRMEDSRSVAGWAGAQEVLTGRVLSVEQVVSTIDAITSEEMARLASELLTASQLRLAVVGPVTAEERLEGLLNL
jgi:predicted Zn-dependent peptidase